MIIIKNKNILNAKEQYLVHQCNCITNHAAGLAYQIFKKFPYSNSYIKRTEPSVPGTIEICGNGINKRFIINLYGQYAPGKHNDKSLRDQLLMRTMYFHDALTKISQIPDIKSIAVPYKIGCGLAGGNWDFYFTELKELDYKLAKFNKNFELVIYNLLDNF